MCECVYRHDSDNLRYLIAVSHPSSIDDSSAPPPPSPSIHSTGQCALREAPRHARQPPKLAWPEVDLAELQPPSCRRKPTLRPSANTLGKGEIRTYIWVSPASCGQ